MTPDTTSALFGKKGVKSFDFSTFLVTILLVAAGLISIYSATYIYTSSFETGMSSIFLKQLVSAGIGLFIMTGIMLLPEKWIQANTLLFYVISIALLLLVLVVGRTVAGTKGWLYLGGFTIQPAEIAKPATLMIVARHLASKGTDIRTFRDFAVVAGLTGLPLILIMLQPDTGSATVLLAIFLTVLLWVGFDIFYLFFIICIPVIIIMSLVGQTQMIITISIMSVLTVFFRKKLLLTVAAVCIFVAVGLASPAIYKALPPHQQARIASFLDPNKDPRGKGYNVLQSKLAVGSGGLTGKGFMQGTQTQLRYIPKQWTDFIFSVPSEEFGFIGSVSVILLITILILRAARIAMITDNPFSSILSLGIAGIFFYHFFINIGMAIGLLPVMGIPLPFMSAGGTSLIVNMAMVGLLLNIQRNKKIKR